VNLAGNRDVVEVEEVKMIRMKVRAMLAWYELGAHGSAYERVVRRRRLQPWPRCHRSRLDLSQRTLLLTALADGKV